MKPSGALKFELAAKIAAESLDADLLLALSQGRVALYKALNKHGLSWDIHTRTWAATPPRKGSFTDEKGCPTGKVTIRITTHPDLMNAVADRIERSLVKRGSKILSSSNFVKSKRGEHVHVFIQARWPNEEETEE